MVEQQRLVRGGESRRDFRVFVDSGNTFFDISVNTDQIGMGFEADIPENESNMSILVTSRKSHTANVPVAVNFPGYLLQTSFKSGQY